MRLEDYLDFLADDDIRIRGTRVGIESVLDEYVHRGRTPEQIAEQLPALTLEQVYAAILYYLRDPATVGAYLADWSEYCRSAEEAYDRDPPPVVSRLRKPKAQRQGKDAAA
jgi:uncharacterized protein (DUF433 family)